MYLMSYCISGHLPAQSEQIETSQQGVKHVHS